MSGSTSLPPAPSPASSAPVPSASVGRQEGPCVRLEGLGHWFGTVQALDDVALTIPTGSIYGILGPNGAGKTTTIRIMLGLLRPDYGTAQVLGLDPASGPLVRRRIGALLEHDGLYEPMSVRENLEFFARIQGIPLGDRRPRIAQMLDLFGLQEKADQPAGKLSKGMKRKLAIARAILHGPELVILDEPTTGLDARAVAELREVLGSVVRELGVTLVVATHNLAEAERMCDRVGVLERGRVILEGPPRLVGLRREESRVTLTGSLPRRALAAIKAAPGVQDVDSDNGVVQVALEAGARAAPVVKAAVENGAMIESVERPRASLEEAYLEATSGRGVEVSP